MDEREKAQQRPEFAPSKVLAAAAQQLAPVSDTPRLDAELLLAHALGISREALLLGGSRPVPAAFETFLARRLAHEPIAYITGHKAFWTLDLAVTPDVLIPRPDSEILIEAAIKHFGSRSPSTILDLGTGSGALLLAALDQWPTAHGLGVDRSEAALAVAQANAERLGSADRARFGHGDWAAGLDGPFDLILCNPPYVESDAELPPQVARHEPAGALFAGPDGLDDYRRVLPQLAPILAPSGGVCLEIGSAQAETVCSLAAEHDFAASVRKDLAGHDRCVVLTVR